MLKFSYSTQLGHFCMEIAEVPANDIADEFIPASSPSQLRLVPSEGNA